MSDQTVDDAGPERHPPRGCPMTTTTRTPAKPTPPQARTLPPGHVLACAACRLPGDTVAARAEADLLARTHDALHHGGRPTMQVTGGGTCESCRRRRAVRAWHYPPAGAAFQLCAECLPTAGSPADSPAACRVVDLRDRTVVDDQADQDQADHDQADHDQDDVNAGDVGPGDVDQVVTATPSAAGGVWW